ncbi:MAG: potassium transporter TrkG [Peptoniphilaceae bacterium]|nr:Trk family potassium uptake protein [Peptoniphilaceae bacterium]MDD7434260.1 potassium transporter TrkG [Peptoniphilaceae bacterium]MDY3075666.1 potassium transporter TrkG [Peptoniphilaceae bacterium]MDY3987049.1 potassium transporter TrkG [Peptoniphilaceae bacterium]MDY4195855.1 potassium transporter TrkG [Peptoniphilaceae bacterium]
MQEHVERKKFSTFQLISLGFSAVVLLGSFLLMLPISSREGVVTPFLDALFTSTSAVCVTGLVVHDTATYWSSFGQAVILLLIQIGGMGVVTLMTSFSLMLGRKISLKQRTTLQDAISAPQMGGIIRLTHFILKGMFVIEGLGAVIMAPVFIRDFGLRGIWMAIFHSISAFCNAGFDLLGVRGPFSSLTMYRDNPVINLTIALLIIIGGIGFLTWHDIRTHGTHFSQYRTQSKVTLLMTGILLLLPLLYFFFIEFNTLPSGSRFLASFFQAVTPRTAGFNTVDLTRMSEGGRSILTALMLIGGAPGSTAGGLKVTTLAVLFVVAAGTFRREDLPHLFRRRLESGVIRQATTIFLMYLSLFFLGGLTISTIEHLPILTSLFETASALGTVGLTLGITPGLGVVSHIILICLMFLGRVGGLTLIFAAVAGRRKDGSRYPSDHITVG